MTATAEHEAWRQDERRITDKLLMLTLQALPRAGQEAAAKRIRDAKAYPR